MQNLTINETQPNDVDWSENIVHQNWGEFIIVHSDRYYPSKLEGLIARFGEERVGIRNSE